MATLDRTQGRSKENHARSDIAQPEESHHGQPYQDTITPQRRRPSLQPTEEKPNSASSIESVSSSISGDTVFDSAPTDVLTPLTDDEDPINQSESPTEARVRRLRASTEAQRVKYINLKIGKSDRSAIGRSVSTAGRRNQRSIVEIHDTSSPETGSSIPFSQRIEESRQRTISVSTTDISESSPGPLSKAREDATSEDKNAFNENQQVVNPTSTKRGPGRPRKSEARQPGEESTPWEKPGAEVSIKIASNETEIRPRNEAVSAESSEESVAEIRELSYMAVIPESQKENVEIPYTTGSPPEMVTYKSPNAKEAKTLTRDQINLKIRDFILKGAKKYEEKEDEIKKGLIYIQQCIHYTNSSYVKIGITDRTVEDRRDEIKRTCGMYLEPAYKVDPNMTQRFHYISIIENIVSAELHNERRQFWCSKCKSTGANHGEYYEITPEKAVRAVHKWRQWFNIHHPFDEDGKLAPYWRARIKTKLPPSLAETDWEAFTNPTQDEQLTYYSWAQWEEWRKESKKFLQWRWERKDEWSTRAGTIVVVLALSTQQTWHIAVAVWVFLVM